MRLVFSISCFSLRFFLAFFVIFIFVIFIFRVFGCHVFFSRICGLMWSGETFKFSIFNFQIRRVTPNLELEN